MKIEIYSIDNCMYCAQAKALLELHSMKYIEYVLSSIEEREAFKQKFPTARSVPVILIDDKHIGGFTQLQEYLRGLSLAS